MSGEFPEEVEAIFIEELTDAQEWTGFLKDNPEATFYHTIKWKNVIEKTFPYRAIYLTVKNENRRIIGILPAFIWKSGGMRILDSLIFSDYGGPIIEKNYIKEASFFLLKYLKNFGLKENISCAKICFSNDEYNQSFEPHSIFVDDHRGVMEIDLRDRPPDLVWTKMLGQKDRKKIKRFERDGFIIREAQNKSDLTKFFELYSSSMEHIRAQPFPFKFFEVMWDLLHPENLNILLVEKDGIVGGQANFIFDQRVNSAYFGVNRNIASTRYSIAYCLFWNTIRWAEKNGYRYVSLGTTPAKPKSTHEIVNYKQKEKFGFSLHQQKINFIPYDMRARVFLSFGVKAIQTWSTVRNRLPAKLQHSIEKNFRGMF